MVEIIVVDANHPYRCKYKSVQNPRHAVATYPSPMATPWEIIIAQWQRLGK